MFALMSMPRFVLRQRGEGCDHKHMVELPTLAERLEFVRTTCGYPSQSALTDAVDAPRQQWSNWCRRGSVGRSDLKLRQVTGVSIDWLKTGEGQPFPDGPKMFRPEYLGAPDIEQRLIQAETDIDQAASIMAMIVRALTASGSEPAEQLRAQLRKQLAEAPERSAILEAAAVAAGLRETTPTSVAAGRRVAEQRGPYEGP